MPPLAAFIMKVLSAALSLLPALAAGLAADLAVGAGALAPVLRGGYWLRALLFVARQSAPTDSVKIAIRLIIRFLFISICRSGCRHSASKVRILAQFWTCLQASYSGSQDRDPPARPQSLSC